MALIATHLGVVEEEKIDNMSYLFFEDVLQELGHKLTYDAVVNYAGNAFAEKSWEMIMENNPLNVGGENKKTMSDLAGFLSGAQVKIGKGKQPKGKKSDVSAEK